MITSLQNEQVKQVAALQRRKERDETGLFVIEGWHLIGEAVLRRVGIKQVLLCPSSGENGEKEIILSLRQRRIPIVEVDRAVMKKMSSTEEPQGIIAVLDQPHLTWDDMGTGEDHMWLVVDGVQDPGNLGTILRTALAAGVSNIVLTRNTVDLYNPKVLRSTMGAIFSLKVLTGQEPGDIITACRSRKMKLIAGDAGGQSLYTLKDEDFAPPLVLVVGNEGNGLSPLFQGQVDLQVSIPMTNQVESLNVGMAAGIILYDLVRRRIQAGFDQYFL